MSDLRKAAEQALKQLQRDDVYLGHRSKTRTDAIQALRQALAQPKREWIGIDHIKIGQLWSEHKEVYSFAMAVEQYLRESNQ